MTMYGGAPLDLDLDNRSYQQRLESALSWAYRHPEGLFLLQHILGLCGLFSASSQKDQELFMAGKRALAMELVQSMLGCRDGNLIAKSVFNSMFDTAHKENRDAVSQSVEYDTLAGSR